MHALRLGLSFLTRVPVGVVEVGAGDLGRAARAWPVAGLVVGACAVIALGAGTWLASPMAGAVAAVAALAWCSGGLHVDGLSDTLDGWHVNGNAERRLAAMRDPRAGGLGAAFTALFLIGKVVLVAACAERGTAAAALLVAAIVSRAALPLDVLRETAATPGQGLFDAFKRELGPTDAGIAAAIGLLLVAPACLDPRLRSAVIVGSGAALVAGVVWTRAWRRRIGGCNGDVLGAAVEIREAAVLLALAGPLVG